MSVVCDVSLHLLAPLPQPTSERSIFEVDNNFNLLVRKLWRRDAN